MKFFIVALSLISVVMAVPGAYDLGYAPALSLGHTASMAIAGPALTTYAAAPLVAAAPVVAVNHGPAGLGGNGFGPGGHFSPMPVQQVQLVPVPQPYPVAQPIPVDKPYTVPVDKPYTVPIDRPVAAPYVAKVVQPMIHKQTVVSSAILSAGHK